MKYSTCNEKLIALRLTQNLTLGHGIDILLYLFFVYSLLNVVILEAPNAISKKYFHFTSKTKGYVILGMAEGGYINVEETLAACTIRHTTARPTDRSGWPLIREEEPRSLKF